MRLWHLFSCILVTLPASYTKVFLRNKKRYVLMLGGSAATCTRSRITAGMGATFTLRKGS